jgi:mono/diheme cytochrome c family protein
MRMPYLVQLGECIGCHTTTDGRGQPDRTMAFAGGRRFVVAKGFGDELFPDPVSAPGAAEPSGTIVTSANITPPASGIAFYDEDIFIKTIRTGRVAGVRALSSAMPWVFFRNMTDDDLRAVFAYLKTVRPVAHRVSNVDPPTLCPRCGRRHGLGDLNPPNPK